ncbi:MAG: hypothetical protein K9M60_04325 [Akkermansiaceae bacterium]|nr:hypothetical protein [Akkermansiaceae bacterium]
MFKLNSKLLRIMALWLSFGHALMAQETPTAPEKPSDSASANRFWQATLGGGHYMVALDRISSVSRHKYVLDGALIVDEVTVDALGQSLARFYFITPISDAVKGNGAAAVVSSAVDRGREMIDKAAATAGAAVHEMVVKKFPETTHARTIEFRLLSEAELTGLYDSVRAAWESGRGRKFAVK